MDREGLRVAILFRHCSAAARGASSMKRPSKSAAQALAESPLAGLFDRAQLLDRITSAVTRYCRETAGVDQGLPPPGCTLEGRTVIVIVGTPSQAAKLRQQAPALHQLLQACDPELTGFRIRLQPGQSADPAVQKSPTMANVRPPPSEESLGAALGFAEHLTRTLHDSALRRSVLRLRSTLLSKLHSSDELRSMGRSPKRPSGS